MNKRTFGQSGEKLAANLLISKGFKIIEANFQCRVGEIDIIAVKDGEIYFVEVKTRKGTNFGDPLESITPSKQRQIIKVAKYFMMRYKKEVACHFSAIGITIDEAGEPDIRFIPDAFMEMG